MMQEAVLKIGELGAPPEGFEEDVFPGDEGVPPDETLDLWEAYQDAADSIIRPVTWEEAEILIKCCPTDHMAGIEWTVLHGIESVFNPEAVEDFRTLIEKCNSDMMKDMLLKRLQNYIRSRE
ncbi:MAG: hypothetical protein HFJ80_01300 [Clostridiales bacterium]|nr:hypothetical protein [Clostridiales bacterium]